MQLEYTGRQTAAITFVVRGRAIRTGNNDRDRIIEVSEAEAALLLGNHGALFRKVEAKVEQRAAPEPTATPATLAALREAGVSAALVTALETRYGDAALLATATDEDLLAIEGLGPATLLKIRKVIQ